MLLVMIVGCFSGITIRVSAASYTYNWGTRGVNATELSGTAKAWYSKYNTSYEKLSSYSGASSTSSVPSSALYKQLQSLMKGAHKNINSYGDNKTTAKYTDCQNGGGKISSFYSGIPVGPSWDGSWNREHTWPNSKGLGGSDEDDVMMIRPTSYSENSGRGNTAYGESSSYYNPNKESGGKYDLRGDCARICLYVYVRWGNTSRMWGSSGVMESKEVLLKWMKEDPVDTWELGRNDSVQSITGTRNVFVDYPELAFDLFNTDVPAGYQSPSGGTPKYTITAVSNNTAYGTVSVSGKTITATPKTGYYVSGYTVKSGSATVTQDGNQFTVNASGNCTIQINFAAKASFMVTYMAAGQQYTAKSVYGGDVIALSNYTGAVPEGYTFCGWVTTSVTLTTGKPATIYAPGGSFTVNGDTTFYALFSYTKGGTGEKAYMLTDLAEIDANAPTVITVTTSDGTVYAMTNNNGTSAGPTGDKTLKISEDGKTLTAEPGDILKWQVGGSADAYIFYPYGSTATWLYCTSGNNGVRVGTNTDNTFRIDADTGYLRHNGTSRYLGVYTPKADWRCYTNNGGNIADQTIGFYTLRDAGATYYTTNPGQCEHSYDAGVVTLAPTCTEEGITTFTCTICGHSDTQSIAATGHDYTTTTTPDYIISTCTVCGHTITQSLNAIPGDIDGNGEVNRDDVIALLLHVSMPAAFPICVPADFNGDGVVTRDDVVALLLHISMPDAFPLIPR